MYSPPARHTDIAALLPRPGGQAGGGRGRLTCSEGYGAGEAEGEGLGGQEGQQEVEEGHHSGVRRGRSYPGVRGDGGDELSEDLE